MNEMNIGIDRLIYSLVRGLHDGRSSETAAGIAKPVEYPRYGEPTKALYLAFDVRASFYPEKKESQYKQADASCSLHYLFNCPYASRGFVTTHTFATVQDSPFAKLEEIRSWEFLSSHDSCWRDAARDKAWQVERMVIEILAQRAGFAPDDWPPNSRVSWFVNFPIFN